MNDAGLIFKTSFANLEAVTPPNVVSDGISPEDGSTGLFGDSRDEAFIDVIARVIAELRKEFNTAINAAIGGRDREIAELKGRVDVLTSLLGQKEFKSGEIIDLPCMDFRRRDVA